MKASGLPPFRVIAAALRATTGRLVGEITEPTNTAPAWSDFEWAVARAVCAMQGISGLLNTRLRWRESAGFRDFLAEQHAQMIARETRIDALLAKIDAASRHAGIACVPLKGSAIRALQLHRPGERPQSDVDLLLDAAHLPAFGPLLAALGYELSFATRRHEIYAPTACLEPHSYAEHAANPLKIELHSKVAEALPVELVDITAAIFPARSMPGANPYASLAALFRHMNLHAAGNMRANAMRYIQIYEVAQLARRMGDADWRELLGDDAASAWWLYPSLALAIRHVPGSVPARRLSELHAVCPRRLRERFERASIYDVSWSNLRIAALPGYEWSRTLGETLRLAHSRVYPSRVALDELAYAREAEPQLRKVDWYGAPHARRIARWLFTRPPRVQTITAIAAALRH